MHIQLDPLGGIAGDMFIAAVLDARTDLADGMVGAINATGIPEPSTSPITEYTDSSFVGTRFSPTDPGHAQDASHTPYRLIVRQLREAPLDPPVYDIAIAIFELLAQAEGHVHGVPPEDVTFHELGAWDSIADIVGAAYLIDALNLKSWSIGPIPLGGGRIETAHGPMPVPSPATAKLLEGFLLINDGISGERVTPTGAAILGSLRKQLGEPLSMSLSPMKLIRSGAGFGSRTLPGISNILRVLLFESTTAARMDDRIGIVHFEVDDQTPEDLALGLDAIRAEQGVLDVLQMPAFGKKGRMACQIQVLCDQAALDDVIEHCFRQTTTIGLRWNTVARAKLNRRTVVVGNDDQQVAVKLVKRPGGRGSVKVEAEDIRSLGGHEERREVRLSAERQAMNQLSSDE